MDCFTLHFEPPINEPYFDSFELSINPAKIRTMKQLK